MNRFFIIIPIIAVLSCTNHNRHADKIEFDPDLNTYFSNLADKGYSGAVLIEKNDTILLKRGFGFANRENRQKVSPKTVFNIASVGKQFTAAAILKLYQEKKLRLEDTISKYIAALRDDHLGDITTHQLLTHTSGITEYDRPADTVLSKEAYLEAVKAIQEDSEPQPHYGYSNTGYEILAILIEEVSGSGYEDYLAKNFFEPLDMTDTGFTGDRKWEENHIAKGTGGAVNNHAHVGDITYGNKGSGSVVSNIEDLYKWEKAIRNYAILSKETTKLWFKEHTTAEVDRLFYGYGWRTHTTERNTRLIWHSGWEDAFNAIYYRLIDEGTTIIFLSNYATGLDPVRNVLFPALRTSEVASIIFDPEITVKPLIPIPEAFHTFSGTFYLDDNNYVELSPAANNRTLRIKPFGQALINALYGYSDAEKTMIDSIYNNTARLCDALANKAITIKTFVNAFGRFDEYNFYDQGNARIAEMLVKDSLNYGSPQAIQVTGTAHSYSSRTHHNATGIRFVYPDTIISFDYINYGDEKYLVKNGTNVSDLFLTALHTDGEWMLQDVMRRFQDKKIIINKNGKSLIIENMAESDHENDQKPNITLYMR